MEESGATEEAGTASPKQQAVMGSLTNQRGHESLGQDTKKPGIIK